MFATCFFSFPLFSPLCSLQYSTHNIFSFHAILYSHPSAFTVHPDIPVSRLYPFREIHIIHVRYKVNWGKRPWQHLSFFFFFAVLQTSLRLTKHNCLVWYKVLFPEHCALNPPCAPPGPPRRAQHRMALLPSLSCCCLPPLPWLFPFLFSLFQTYPLLLTCFPLPLHCSCCLLHKLLHTVLHCKYPSYQRRFPVPCHDFTMKPSHHLHLSIHLQQDVRNPCPEKIHNHLI